MTMIAASACTSARNRDIAVNKNDAGQTVDATVDHPMGAGGGLGRGGDAGATDAGAGGSDAGGVCATAAPASTNDSAAAPKAILLKKSTGISP